MSDLPPDLPRLRTLRVWHAMWVDRLDAAIAAAEQREAERARGAAARPPDPDWLIERGLNKRAAVYVHEGTCWAGRKATRTQGITREQALQAMAEGVDVCPQRRPDTALGVLD
ncbi:DUF6233 domain-containing protein [Streptomyces sp. NPDC102406]|uniref:DUF6233 domain-containing protein n=1 Tax=Streptomyces sp. NPDC102406 TaxID=3366171 RepID=UPI0037FFBF0F